MNMLTEAELVEVRRKFIAKKNALNATLKRIEATIDKIEDKVEEIDDIISLRINEEVSRCFTPPVGYPVDDLQKALDMPVGSQMCTPKKNVFRLYAVKRATEEGPNHPAKRQCMLDYSEDIDDC